MRPRPLDAVVFGGLIALALGRVADPFTGDQALNMLMGKLIASGGAPYADLWDLKHPGVFFFFASGGAIFGFDEVGIHLFEALWMLTLAVLVRVVAARYTASRNLAAIAPALVVGAYYAGAPLVALTQTEALVGLPILLSLATASSAVQPTSRMPGAWLFASGLAAGVLVVFKAPYVALPALFWLIALARRRREPRSAPFGTIRLVLALLSGFLVPVSAVVAYLARSTDLHLVWWTFVVHPGRAAGETIVDPKRLYDGSVWFVRTFWPLLILAAVGAFDRLRRAPDFLTICLIGWMCAGALLIWLQVISWWGYHYLLVLVPTGLLATQGIARLWTTAFARKVARGWQVTATAGLCVLLVLTVPRVTFASSLVAEAIRQRPLWADPAALRAHQAARNPEYAIAADASAFLRRAPSQSGPIYVFATPLVYQIADRRPAAPYLAPWFAPTKELWLRLATALEAAEPPYVLVTESALTTMRTYNPAIATDIDAFLAQLQDRYRRLSAGAGGTWYVRRDSSSS